MPKRWGIAGDKFAIYERGAWGNAPLTSPLAYLDKLSIHSDADYLQVAFRASATIAHPSVAHSGYSASGGSAFGRGITAQPSSWRASPAVVTHVLHTHGLGYVPYVQVKLGSEVIEPCYPVQQVGANGVRTLSVVVTTTQVLLRESVLTWAGTLAAISRTYDVIGLLKASPTAPTRLIHAGQGFFQAGGARFDSTKRYLRAAAPSEPSALLVSSGKTADAARGVVRAISATGVVRDDAVFDNAAWNYNGSFTAANLNTKRLSVADANEYGGATFSKLDTDGLLVVDQGRVVLDSSRSMAKIVAEVALTNRDFVFPNPPQDSNTWQMRFIDSYTDGGNSITVTNKAFGVSATWVPQEWSLRTVLATLPTDKANFLMGLGRCSRTVNPAQIGGSGTANAPSSNGETDGAWGYATLSNFRDIQKGVAEGVLMSITGTIVLEFAYMLRRTLSFAIEGNELVALQQQSIGGYDTTSQSYRGPDLHGYWANGNLGSANTEVIARVHRLGARIYAGIESGTLFDGATNYNPAGAYNWSSTWRFQELKFLIGHV